MRIDKVRQLLAGVKLARPFPIAPTSRCRREIFVRCIHCSIQPLDSIGTKMFPSSCELLTGHRVGRTLRPKLRKPCRCSLDEYRTGWEYT